MTDDDQFATRFSWRFGRLPIDWGDVPGGYGGRRELAPSKIELLDGKLFQSDEQRLTMVALLLENLGVDAVMRLGDPQMWREAAAALPATRSES